MVDQIADPESCLMAWREAFKVQATPELYEKATRFAARRAKHVAAAGGPGDDQYVDDLVQGAIADTYSGLLDWNHERSSLEQHIMRAIKSRSRHDRKRATEFPNVSLDAYAQGGEAAEIRAEAEVSLAKALPDPRSGLAKACLESLRELAVQAHDSDVLRVLDAIELGAFAKDDLLADTGLSERRYRNAKSRLATYIERLPADLCPRPTHEAGQRGLHGRSRRSVILAG